MSEMSQTMAFWIMNAQYDRVIVIYDALSRRAYSTCILSTTGKSCNKKRAEAASRQGNRILRSKPGKTGCRHRRTPFLCDRRGWLRAVTPPEPPNRRECGCPAPHGVTNCFRGHTNVRDRSLWPEPLPAMLANRERSQVDRRVGGAEFLKGRPFPNLPQCPVGPPSQACFSAEVL